MLSVERLDVMVEVESVALGGWVRNRATGLRHVVREGCVRAGVIYQLEHVHGHSVSSGLV